MAWSSMKGCQEKDGWLTGQILVAMPGMLDPRFEKTIIFMCSHGPDGAMGLVINRLYGDLNFPGLLTQFNLSLAPGIEDLPIYYGGPVEPVRGFVLHSSDYKKEGTTPITPTISMTATVEVLSALSQGKGPGQALLVLGYAGWAAGQLENEIQANGWLTVPADDALIFDVPAEDKWARAMATIGVVPTMLSTDVGHA